MLVGLGDGTKISAVRVDWPDGRSEEWPGPPINRYTTLVQKTGWATAAKE